MIENYNYDLSTNAFTSGDISSNKYMKLFTVRKNYYINVMFNLSYSYSNTNHSFKRLNFSNDIEPLIFDYDTDSYGIDLKVIEEGENYSLYAKIPNTTSLKLKIIQCDTPNLIKFTPRENAQDITSLKDVTKIKVVNKKSNYYSILKLINFDWFKQFGTQILLQDENEINGHLFVKGNYTGDGNQICTMPIPLVNQTESTFLTFCAMYQGNDSLWYGCTLRLENTGALKVYGVGTNAPSYISIKANLHYRCGKSVLSQLM